MSRFVLVRGDLDQSLEWKGKKKLSTCIRQGGGNGVGGANRARTILPSQAPALPPLVTSRAGTHMRCRAQLGWYLSVRRRDRADR